VEKMNVEEIEKEFFGLFSKIDEVQGNQDLTCSETQCVSERLSEFKMIPNSKECKGYWNR